MHILLFLYLPIILAGTVPQETLAQPLLKTKKCGNYSTLLKYESLQEGRGSVLAMHFNNYIFNNHNYTIIIKLTN